MADTYVPSKASSSFADISAFTGDANAINAATKTALNTALANIRDLWGPEAAAYPSAAHPDFNKISPAVRAALDREIDALIAAVTAHA